MDHQGRTWTIQSNRARSTSVNTGRLLFNRGSSKNASHTYTGIGANFDGTSSFDDFHTDA